MRDIILAPTPKTPKGVLPDCGRTPYFYLKQYNFTQTKRPVVRKNTDFRSFLYNTENGGLPFPSSDDHEENRQISK